MFDSTKFNKVQLAALELMQSDLRFLYTLIWNYSQINSNYVVSTLPYIGLIVDGIEDWINRYNRSNKNKLAFPVFTEKEQEYYAEIRNAIKLWSLPYDDIYSRISTLYKENEEHFAQICKPIVRRIKLYKVFGVDYANGEICGNTIMCAYYLPNFTFAEGYGEFLKSMSIIAGRYIHLFDAVNSYSVDSSVVFSTKDFGGREKSPVGDEFSDRFILFSILGQIQYLLLCVEQYITDDCSTKLRFEYILYYYLNTIIPAINYKLNTNFRVDLTYHSDLFRNAMAHYSLGVALKPDELVESDPLWGLTQKYFQCDYYTVKKRILVQLRELSTQIKDYLHLN